jgi:hypothetical protein
MKGLSLLFGLTALCLTSAPSVFAQKSVGYGAAAQRVTSMTEQCEQLWKQFDAADTSQVAATKLAEAKKRAAHGNDLCAMEASEGIKELTSALHDIGVRPRKSSR